MSAEGRVFRWSAPRVLGSVFALLVLSLLFAFSFHKVGNLDIGWHLKAGEYIVANRTVPEFDIFSYTATDRPYIDSQWLFQVVVYSVYALFGVYGLNLLIVAVLGALFIILFRLVDFNSRPCAAAFFFFLAIVAGSERFMVRPELFTFLFVAVYLYILHRDWNHRAVYLLIPFQVMWVNMHGLYVLGPVMVLCYVVGGLAQRKLPLPFEWNKEASPDTRGVYRLAVVFVLMVLVTFVNPYGYRLFLFPLKLFLEISDAANVVKTSVSEMQSPFSGSPALNREAVMFYKLLAVSSMLTFVLNYRRVNLPHLFIYTAFLILSVMAVRNITPFAVVSAPVAVLNMTGARDTIAALGPLRGRFVGPGLRWGVSAGLVVVIVYYLLSVFSNDYYLRNSRLTRWGAGLSQVRYPEAAIDFVLENGIKGRVFNNPGLGGYFIWRSYPREKVFFDGRFEVYSYDFFNEYMAVEDDPQRFNPMTDSYGVNYVLYEYTAGPSRFTRYLFRDPRWSLVFCDDVAVVFVKNTAENTMAIKNARCDLAGAPSADLGAVERTYLERVDEGFFARSGRLLRLFSEGRDPMRHYRRGIFFIIMGLGKRAEEELLRSLEMFPRQQRAHFNLGLVYLDQGRTERAAREFGFALEANPDDVMAGKYMDFLGGRYKK
jgi:hypothetical protein